MLPGLLQEIELMNVFFNDTCIIPDICSIFMEEKK